MPRCCSRIKNRLTLTASSRTMLHDTDCSMNWDILDPWKTVRIYLAAPLFSMAQRQFNEDLKAALEGIDPDWEIVLPQEHSDLLNKDAHEFPEDVYRWCIGELEKVDQIVAILDGSDADSGTCIEMGYARAIGKRIVGVRTDKRGSEDQGTNIMVSRCCDVFLWRPDCDRLKRLAEDIAEAIESL